MKAGRRLRLPGLLLLALVALPASAADLPPPETLRAWVEEMKAAERGPFENIRWFCKDGTVLPPKPYACAKHGGGIQHGNWSARARAMRDGGYLVANVLAGIDPQPFTGPDAELDTLRQILLERFLIGWDNGWVLRAARSYRGALQAEDEEAGARALVLALLADPEWRSPNRFMLLREAVRLLPLQADDVSASHVRVLALQIDKDDADFRAMRIKIHNQPEESDAAAVRAYAKEGGKPAMAERYEELATSVDALYAPAEAVESLRALSQRVDDPDLAQNLRQVAARLGPDTPPPVRFATATPLLATLRDAFYGISDPEDALALLDTSLDLELAVFRDGNTVVQGIDGLSRIERLWLLNYTSTALYGVGFLGNRQRGALEQSVIRLEDLRTPALQTYREELRYLARAPEWCARWLEYDFGPTVARWTPIEPEVLLYTQDRMRGSPLLLYSRVIDELVLDANRLAGIEYELFGERIGAGLRALNPGLARGPLRTLERGAETVQRDAIYLLPETISDLPRVAGILTMGEGSSLSHVQLLARNLGIPNVVVSESVLPQVRARLGDRAVMAVSPNGVVQLAEDGPAWDEIFGIEHAQPAFVIKPDLERLDLSGRDFLPISSLRASDSGRISGPKGANLGELRFFFGEAVPPGFVIPFGVFRQLLDRNLQPGGPSVFEWMKQQYAAIDRAEGDPKRQDRIVREFLARLRQWILEVDPGDGFRSSLETALARLGPDGSFGVFVRSDTNVEDLPGFTGAGLNLTLPNVVGSDAVLAAIHEVWASPFTERAYGWRQDNMTQPEYVFPAVTVQLAFPAEKSGVMVTSDLDSGSREWLTIAASEGVGGAVEGQATESLLVNARNGEVRLLAQATAPDRAVLSSGGGVDHVPARAPEVLLQPAEVEQLIAFAADVTQRFTSLEGAPADIEFAFKDGRLALLQIRPFVESKRAQQSSYLNGLDADFRARGAVEVVLYAIPDAAGPPTRVQGEKAQ
ncbi:MAG: phosphoenolpyruvate synthase [Deltaproteobacteria bacterium]|nr:phosphoenolpyruvate synthase [Deltaproteobacteria bacterium]